MESKLIFPKWINKVVALVLVGGGLATFAGAGTTYFISQPEFTDIGYQPTQPVPYSHKLHAGQIGMDCRFCHSTVEKTGFAAIPPTQTCMLCHTAIKNDSPKLARIRESFATGNPVEWKKVHKVADFAYFNHSAHVNAGVGCSTCHGRIDQMDVVKQVSPVSMPWCIACHKEPEKVLRPLDQITKMDWEPGSDQVEKGRQFVKDRKIKPPVENCWGCHR
ncbi:MAG TPA: cytochrome c3 family protein [Blastocatellia bacterium]|nr:cytochrome c3 family protein [Blastocatellia bacterium]